jgi:DNA-binding LacI/PurR family transcriptional regulator
MNSRPLTPQERRELAAKAMMDERVVARAYVDPSRVRPTTIARLERAAAELGLPPPRREAA